ncbi:glycosyl hydrolase family 18 protein [Anaerocolumna sp. AGMB13025]|uniref:glycosyl hydrolase family 18 protein n=1 Tax=Anaerocolumna sp. AGMB13025 TaxID=3039116 RepID=UPI00242040A7|nr:glycosyl hydrolase family 18 protein [Anaerocolumna sp. AGMB13025]WFR57746.1 glycosyl hydrolase family 18 protein [Anaerocolumna sp. AGMB13025]
MDRRGKQAIIGTLIALVLFAVIIGAAIIKKFTPSNQVMNLTDYYKLNTQEVAVILQDKIYDKKALSEGGTIYLDYDTVTGLLNKRFYWDANENLLSYTTPTEIIKAEAGSKDYTVNEDKNEMDYPVVIRKGEVPYIALDFVKQYSDMRYEYFSTPDRIVIQYQWGDYLFTKVKKDSKLRYEPDIKSDILAELKAEDLLSYVDTSEVVKNGFSKVMTKDGIIGYVQSKYVEESYYDSVKSDFKAPEYTHIKEDGAVNLVWHQVTNRDANNNLTKLINKTKGVTAISPTWFTITDSTGNIASLADKSYVEKAHSLGIKVWALVDDFNTEVSMTELLSHTSSREKLIQELLKEAKEYDLDGINIDFEKIPEGAGIHYIQFIRELSVTCRNEGIVLSIDNYVPSSYTTYYDREEQGIVADYVVIMAYDEHHAGSEESGSVSSLGFVDNAITNILEMVPKERVIMGIPFYTRQWKETTEDNGSISVSSEAFGMVNAQSVLENNGVEPKWDEKTGQYYGEYEKDGATYKIWLEEEDSIEAKLKLINKAGMAGIACWKLGLEDSKIWNIINKYIK